MLTERFDNALTYASWVHGGQKRKGTKIPYISHLLTVASIVLENGGNEDEAIAALLHDAAEDQGGVARLDDIRSRFGEPIAQIVEACSDSLVEDSSDKAPWHQRKERYRAELENHANPSNYLVSAADKLHNARAMAQDERQSREELWSRFNASKGCIVWNLSELARIYAGISDERVRQVARELQKVITELKTANEGECREGEPQCLETDRRQRQHATVNVNAG
jgi:(p)ppGpp synthase/HD superfamily hydrolase